MTEGCSPGRWFSRWTTRWSTRARVVVERLRDTWFPRWQQEYFNDEGEWIPFPPLLTWLAWLALMVALGFTHGRPTG